MVVPFSQSFDSSHAQYFRFEPLHNRKADRNGQHGWRECRDVDLLSTHILSCLHGLYRYTEP